MDIRDFITHEKDIIQIDKELEKYEMAKIVHENPTSILQFKDKGYDVYCNIWSTRDRLAKYLKLDKSTLLFSLKESMDNLHLTKSLIKVPLWIMKLRILI